MADLYADHNVAMALARLLRAAGHDVECARDAGMAKADDDEQLLYAADHGRALVTHDNDFVLLHRAWRRWSRAWGIGRAHCGILLLAQEDPDRLAQELEAFFRFGHNLDNAMWRWQPAAGWVCIT